MKFEMLSKILVNGNIETVVGIVKGNGNVIVLKNNHMEMISSKTNKYLGNVTIEELIKYDNKINYMVTNTFLYYLLNIEMINKYNGIVEDTI